MAALKAKLAETEEKLKQRHDQVCLHALICSRPRARRLTARNAAPRCGRTLAQLLRAVADADNIRKRTAVDVENAHKFSIGAFAKNLLEVADNLERAIALVPEDVRTGAENSKFKMLYEGVRLTDEQLVKSFETVGLKRINPIGEKFNPNIHEALFEIPDPSKDAGTVGQVLSVGYTLHERCLRPAKVGVVSKK